MVLHIFGVYLYNFVVSKYHEYVFLELRLFYDVVAHICI